MLAASLDFPWVARGKHFYRSVDIIHVPSIVPVAHFVFDSRWRARDTA